MRAVLQRVTWARVTVAGEVVGKIGPGLLVLLGAGAGDTEEDVEYLAGKTVNLRIFEDEQQNMNRSLLEVGGALLVVSQFTLYGDATRGNRPSYSAAAPPERAQALLELFVAELRALGHDVQTGRFRAAMQVTLENDGPVTLILESRGRPDDQPGLGNGAAAR